ncbi:hypothetical protein X777_07006, partial [Ooceraea biroi]
AHPVAYSHGNYRCMHGNYYNSYFFFWAFSAALVTLPAASLKHQSDDGGVAGLDGLRVLLGRLTGTAIALFLNLGELASDVGGVTIQHGRVAVADLTGMIENTYLRGEVSGTLGWIVLGISSNVSTTQLLNRHVLDVEANVVTGHGFLKSLVMHLH